MISKENPFAYLTQTRAAQEKQESLQRVTQERVKTERYWEEERIRQARLQRREPHIERVDAMVTDILAALAEAAYPASGESIIDSDKGYVANNVNLWEIRYRGSEYVSGWDGGWRSTTKTALSVALVFDAHDEPLHFLIQKGEWIEAETKLLGMTLSRKKVPNPGIQCGLSEQEFVDALKTLYPGG